MRSRLQVISYSGLRLYSMTLDRFTILHITSYEYVLRLCITYTRYMNHGPMHTRKATVVYV